MIKAMLTGRLGRDAELKTLEGGRSVINFNVATDQGFGEKKTTLWVECAYWSEKTGVAAYLKKGTQVAVFGEPSLRTWEGRDGKMGAGITLNVAQIELMGGRQEGAHPPEQKQEPAPRYEVREDLPF